MKKILSSFIFSLYVLIVCLGLVEVFFSLNSLYGWIHPLGYSLFPSIKVELPQSEPLPPIIVQKIQKKYADFKYPNADLPPYKTEIFVASNKQSITPLPVSNFIRSFNGLSKPTEFHDKIENLLFHRVIYDAVYHTDHHARRVIPDQKISAQKPNLLMIGCSVTFGQGQNDNKTMPYFMQQEFPGYNVYNMGIVGAGLNDILDDTISWKRMSDFNSKGGVAVFTFIYDHLERTMCSLNCYRGGRETWVPFKNRYDFDEQGHLVNYGSFLTSQPMKSMLYRVLGKSQFLDFAGIGDVRHFGVEDEKKFVRLLVELKKLYQKRGYDFYFYPQDPEKDLTQSMQEELTRNGIKFKVYDWKPLQPWWRQAHYVGDWHFNELGNYISALRIQQMLKDLPPDIPPK